MLENTYERAYTTNAYWKHSLVYAPQTGDACVKQCPLCRLRPGTSPTQLQQESTHIVRVRNIGTDA